MRFNFEFIHLNEQYVKLDFFNENNLAIKNDRSYINAKTKESLDNLPSVTEVLSDSDSYFSDVAKKAMGRGSEIHEEIEYLILTDLCNVTLEKREIKHKESNDMYIKLLSLIKALAPENTAEAQVFTEISLFNESYKGTLDLVVCFIGDNGSINYFIIDFKTGKTGILSNKNLNSKYVMQLNAYENLLKSSLKNLHLEVGLVKSSDFKIKSFLLFESEDNPIFMLENAKLQESLTTIFSTLLQEKKAPKKRTRKTTQDSKNEEKAKNVLHEIIFLKREIKKLEEKVKDLTDTAKEYLPHGSSYKIGNSSVSYSSPKKSIKISVDNSEIEDFIITRASTITDCITAEVVESTPVLRVTIKD